MGVIDIIVILFLLLFTVLGLMRGMLHGMLTFANFIVIFLVAYFLHPVVMNYMGGADDPGRAGIVFVGMFLVFFLVDNLLLGSVLNTLTKVEKPSMFSKTVGTVFGLVKGVMYAGIIMWGVIAAVPDSQASQTIRGGLVSKNVVSVVIKAYEATDGMIRKNNVTPSTILDYQIGE